MSVYGEIDRDERRAAEAEEDRSNGAALRRLCRRHTVEVLFGDYNLMIEGELPLELCDAEGVVQRFTTLPEAVAAALGETE